MPCYDPPPSYEGKARRNAENAAKILCGMVSAMIKENQPVERDLLVWWRNHREIDLEVVLDPRNQLEYDRETEKQCRRDILRANTMLKQMERVK